MASSKLLGTAPDQIPTNGDLGGMAFQTPEAVNFTGGEGALSTLALNPIYKEITSTAIDVFVYDTRKDSDGGAWRKRCGHTSWYNETLNTSTRGSRKDFPAVAIIVLETYAVKIYDGDSSELSMWMVINRFAGANTWWHGFGSNYPTPTALSAMNGIICVSSTDAGNSSSGLSTIRFIADQFYNYCLTTSYNGVFSQNIANRALTGSFGGGSALIHLAANDVAMTVLPNAPIDSVTGLPIPTIAVATSSGVSVIHNNGTVYSITDSNAVWNYFKTVNFTQDYKLIINGTYQLSDNNIIHVCDIPYASYNLNTVNSQIVPLNSRYYHADTSIPNIRNGARSLAFTASIGANSLAIGTGALNLIAERPETQSGITSASMVDYITTTFNTGWMPGNIKGAWLSDTTQETVVGAELVTNGSFTSDVSGWSVDSTGTNSLTASGGQAVWSVTTGSYWCWTPIQVIAGKTYVATVTFTSTTNNYWFGVGSITNGARDILDSMNPGLNTPIIKQFTPNYSGTAYVTIGVQAAAGAQVTFDNVSVRLADADRSVNAKGLHTYGSITKTPVATGADLVAYSGFSTSNYLERPYTNSFDFGTGDFSFALWVKSSNFAAASQFITGIDQAGGSLPKLMIYTFGDGRISLHTNGFETTLHAVTSITPAANVWHQIVCGRKAGVFYMYLNGALSGSAASTVTISFASAAVPLAVGYRTTEPGVSPFNGEISLLRISSTFPSDAQIIKMYNDEKVLFQDNAKATLYGTSDAVTALAYDEDTQLLHAGTSSGRSVFQGLRRVDNTTTAVSAAISASNGLVAEQ